MIDLREIGGRKLACWVNDGGFRADRKTLVFIHGSGGNHTDWIRQFTPLQNVFNIAAMDLPGHGESDGPGEQDVSAYVAWVKRLLEGFGIRKTGPDRPLPWRRHLPQFCHPAWRSGRSGGPRGRGTGCPSTRSSWRG